MNFPIHIPLPKPATYKKVVFSVRFHKLHKAHFKNKDSWVSVRLSENICCFMSLWSPPPPPQLIYTTLEQMFALLVPPFELAIDESLAA